MLTLRKFASREPQYKATLIMGSAAVEAYQNGEGPLEFFAHVGSLKTYHFTSESELNAFLYGIDEARGYLNTLLLDIK